MKKSIIIFFCFIYLAGWVFTTQSNAQEIVSKVTITNELVLPYEDADFPKMASDGTKLIFIRYKDTSSQDLGEIWSVNSNGSGLRRLYGEDGVSLTSPVCSSDCSKVIFLKRDNFELWQMNFDGSGQTRVKPILS